MNTIYYSGNLCRSFKKISMKVLFYSMEVNFSLNFLFSNYKVLTHNENFSITVRFVIKMINSSYTYFIHNRAKMSNKWISRFLKIETCFFMAFNSFKLFSNGFSLIFSFETQKTLILMETPWSAEIVKSICDAMWETSP